MDGVIDDPQVWEQIHDLAQITDSLIKQDCEEKKAIIIKKRGKKKKKKAPVVVETKSDDTFILLLNAEVQTLKEQVDVQKRKIEAFKELLGKMVTQTASSKTERDKLIDMTKQLQLLNEMYYLFILEENDLDDSVMDRFRAFLARNSK
jgi:ABC-type methionine transport system ATPase subunit